MDGAHESSVGYFLHTYPLVQSVHIVVVIISLPPVIMFLTQISKIALHDNYKFLLLTWSSSFLLCILIHCAYIGCDLATGKYIAASNRDPPIRLYMFSVHGFAHALSSGQELMLSIERAVSCSWPERYHSTGLAWHVLIVAESLALIPALTYLWQLSNGNLTAASCVTNSLDFASLVGLSATSYYVIRRTKAIRNSSLNEKYQFSSTLAAWIYAYQVFDSQYMLTVTASAYFFLATLNCMICCTIVLRRHAGLRRITEQLICPRRRRKVRDKQTAEAVREIYFDALKKDWE